LFAEQGAGAKKTECKGLKPRCLAAVRRVNGKGGRGIYLVDNKQGGIECAELMYTVPNLNIAGFLKIFLNFLQALPIHAQKRRANGAWKAVWGRLLIGGLTEHK
jgi:hypothetical protein